MLQTPISGAIDRRTLPNFGPRDAHPVAHEDATLSCWKKSVANPSEFELRDHREHIRDRQSIAGLRMRGPVTRWRSAGPPRTHTISEERTLCSRNDRV